jgi:hypothetical protein
MPSTNQASTNSEPIPEWRQEIRTDIGEDPGRWLD